MLSDTVNPVVSAVGTPRNIGSITPDDDFVTVCGREYTNVCVSAHDDGVGRFEGDYQWYVGVTCDCRGQNAAPRPKPRFPFFERLNASECIVHVKMAFHYILNNRD